MPRPARCRRVCAKPIFKRFFAERESPCETVVLKVDEYEVVRIVDLEKRSHEHCAQQMQISRTTVTEIYEAARFKLADAIVNGKRLIIEGGNYVVCGGENRQNCPGRAGCWQKYSDGLIRKSTGETKMKIAVPVKHEMIYQHFGMASNFKLYTVENGKVTVSEVITSEGHGHGVKLNILLNQGVTSVICGGIGDNAINAFNTAGIDLIAGITGEADEAVAAYLDGTLIADMEAARSKQRKTRCPSKECGAGNGSGHCHGHGHGHGECGPDDCGCGKGAGRCGMR